jgi:hypothetical protein
MATTSEKGLPKLIIPDDSSVPLPNPQSYFQSLATAIDARVPQIGSKINAGVDTFAQAAYAQAPTPDRVQSVVLPTDGVLVIGFVALWKVSVAATCAAAIFLGSNQVQWTRFSIAPTAQESSTGAGLGAGYSWLTTTRFGLAGGMVVGADSSLVNTGMTMWSPQVADGGLCYIFAAAGTYDVSVQWKNSAGNLSIKERRLWVHAVPYL